MQPPSFDTWTTIFLFAAIQGLFVTLVILIKKKAALSNVLMALIILLFSITLIEYVLYWTRYQIYFPHVINISAPFPFLTGVFFYLYFRVIFEKKKVKWSDWPHLIPFTMVVIYFLPMYICSADVKLQWIQGIQTKPSWINWPAAVNRIRWMVPWLGILHMSCYAFLTIHKYFSLSKTDKEVAVWFNWLIGLFILYIASFASYFILVNYDFFNIQWDYMISFSMMLFIYFIAWFGYLQPRVFNGFSLAEAIVSTQRYANSALPADLNEEVVLQLNDLMSGEKLYRDSELRLEKLAERLNLSRHNLSQIINEQFNMNFFEYVNSYRIQEATELLSTTSRKQLNIMEIAFNVGFNNKVSFNNTFKKITGKTPTEYRNETFKELNVLNRN